MTDTLPTIYPRRTALLVMDFQPAVLGSLGEAEALLSRTAAAISLIRQHGGQVGYVRVAFEDADYDAIPDHSQMAARMTAAGNPPQPIPRNGRPRPRGAYTRRHYRP